MNGKMEERKKRRPRAFWISLGAALLAALLLLAASLVPYPFYLPAYNIPPRGEGELRLHFLDIGQGDAQIVEFPDGDLLVVDAGNGTLSCRNRLIRYIKGLKKGETQIEMLLTHADKDHYGGFRELLSVFGASKFYLPAVDGSAEDYRSLLKKIEETCPAERAKRYLSFTHGEAYAVLINPYSAGEEDENDSSAVLYIGYRGFSAVLCGDISAARERRLAEEYLLDGTLFDSGGYAVRLAGVDVLKAAHHGSASSSCEEWVGLLSPEYSVVTAGRGNNYRHPAGEALERLGRSGQVLRTDELGNIMITVNGREITVTTEREQ